MSLVSQSRDLTPRQLQGPPAYPREREEDMRRAERPGPPARGYVERRVIRMGRINAPVTGDPRDAVTAAEGLGRDAWEGTHPKLAQGLLEVMPLGTSSPTLGALARAVLSTPGPRDESVEQMPRRREQLAWNASQGDLGSLAPMRAQRPEYGAPLNSGESAEYRRLRLAHLMEAGYFDDVVSRIEALRDEEVTEADAELLASGRLLQGETGKACDLALEHRLQSDSQFWIELRAFCYLEEKAGPAAQLTADLLRERNVEAPLFYSMIRHLAGGEDLGEADFSGDITPLTYALLRKAGHMPPEDTLSRMKPAVLHALVRDYAQFGGSGADISVLKAAQTAVYSGALAPKALAELYDRIGFPENAGETAQAFVEKLPAELAAAFLYQQAKTASVPALRAEFLNEALKAAEGTPRYLPMVLAFGDLIGDVEPVPHLGWISGRLGVAALALGETEKAMRWYEIVSAEAARGGSLDVLMQRSRLGFALAVSDERAARALLPHLGIAERIARAQSGEESSAVLSRDLQVLTATGVPLPSVAELWLLEFGQDVGVAAPPVSATARLADAVNKRRMAEGIALSLIVAGEDGPLGKSPYFLAQSIRALSVMGLNREARRLALEAVLAPVI